MDKEWTGERAHWDKIHATGSAGQWSWHRFHLDTSLELIRHARLGPGARIIDIGGGASTLVDDLLAMGFHDLSVLDVSPAAMEIARQRLESRSAQVRWIVGDVIHAKLEERYFHLWHDGALFHFFVQPSGKAAYVAAATRAVKDGGFLVISTFAVDGPTRCSGLPVERYGPDELARQFPAFSPLVSRAEDHRTPSGTLQRFTTILMQRV